MTTIVESQDSSAELLLGAVGGGADVVASIEELRQHLMDRSEESVIVLGPSVNLTAAASLAETLRVDQPALSVILVRQRVDTSVLGDALRSGMREVVEQRDLTGLSLAVRRGQALYKALTASIAGPEGSLGGRLVTVFSPKGGVGKTTLSTNLAMSLSLLGHRVCLVDLDLGSGDVAITLQLSAETTLVDALGLPGDLGAEELEPLLTKYSDNLWTLLAPNAPELHAGNWRHTVSAVLISLKQSFDYVVVDSPPAFDDHVLQAFDQSDLLLLLLTLDIPALKNLKITLETLHLLNFPREKYSVVLNRADSKVGLTPGEVEQTLKATISASIPSSHEVPASVNRGQTMVASLPKHPISQIFMRIARDAVEAMPSVTPRVTAPATTGTSNLDSDRRGLFRRKTRTA
jgi:pilus assembly protein CpaE